MRLQFGCYFLCCNVLIVLVVLHCLVFGCQELTPCATPGVPMENYCARGTIRISVPIDGTLHRMPLRSSGPRGGFGNLSVSSCTGLRGGWSRHKGAHGSLTQIECQPSGALSSYLVPRFNFPKRAQGQSRVCSVLPLVVK